MSVLPIKFQRKQNGDLLLLVRPGNFVLVLAVAAEAGDARTLGALELELIKSSIPALAVGLWSLLNINQAAHAFVFIFLLFIEVSDVAWS